jgi:DnaJ-domain-containing protein 1
MSNEKIYKRQIEIYQDALFQCLLVPNYKDEFYMQIDEISDITYDKFLELEHSIEEKTDFFYEQIKGLIKLHECELFDKMSSQEADGVRDSMEKTYNNLSPEDHEKLVRLSKMLYEISDKVKEKLLKNATHES